MGLEDVRKAPLAGAIAFGRMRRARLTGGQGALAQLSLRPNPCVPGDAKVTIPCVPEPFIHASNPEVFFQVPELGAGVDGLSLNERGDLVAWEKLGDVVRVEITPAREEDF